MLAWITWFLTSLGASFSMKSVYIFLAFEDSFWGDLVFLKSSQASQNSIFSSQNSDFKNALNAASPSESTKKQVACKLSDRIARCSASAGMTSSLAFTQTCHAHNVSSVELWDASRQNTKVSILQQKYTELHCPCKINIYRTAIHKFSGNQGFWKYSMQSEKLTQPTYE